MPTNLIQYSMETNFKTQLLFFKTYKYLKIINGGGGGGGGEKIISLLTQLSVRLRIRK